MITIIGVSIPGCVGCLVFAHHYVGSRSATPGNAEFQCNGGICRGISGKRRCAFVCHPEAKFVRAGQAVSHGGWCIKKQFVSIYGQRKHASYQAVCRIDDAVGIVANRKTGMIRICYSQLHFGEQIYFLATGRAQHLTETAALGGMRAGNCRWLVCCQRVGDR